MMIFITVSCCLNSAVHTDCLDIWKNNSSANIAVAVKVQPGLFDRDVLSAFFGVAYLVLPDPSHIYLHYIDKLKLQLKWLCC